jgi:hypothetical protein
LTLSDLAAFGNPILRGWINYYGRFYRSRLALVLRRVTTTLLVGPYGNTSAARASSSRRAPSGSLGCSRTRGSDAHRKAGSQDSDEPRGSRPDP